jgi:hypothetical protein
MRRSVPSWPKGGGECWAAPSTDRTSSATLPSARPWPPLRPRPCAGAGSTPSRTGSGHPPRAQRGPQQHQEDMNPLMDFALSHPEQPACTTWRGRPADRPGDTTADPRGSAADSCCRWWTACDARLSVDAPVGDRSLEGGLKGQGPRAGTRPRWDWSNPGPPWGGSGDRRAVTFPWLWPPFVASPGYHKRD